MKNTVTANQIDKIIKEGTVNVITLGEKTTLVEFITKEGFVMIESSSCVDKSNYNEEIGKNICLERIRNKLWEFEGYWLQKDLFYNEKTRGDCEPSLKERVKIERDQIDGRLEKLEMFIGTEKFSKLSLAQRSFLIKQSDIMREYIAILDLRLSVWED